MPDKVVTQEPAEIVSDYDGPRFECYICGKEAIAYCDYILNADAPNGTLVCDRPLCAEHIHRPFPTLDIDYCPEHCLCNRRKGES